MSVGRSSSSPSVQPSSAKCVSILAPACSKKTRRVRVMPFEWMPLTAMPMTRSPGSKVAADEDAVERHGADRGADQVEAAHDIAQLRNLAAGDRDVRLPRALGQADRDAVEHRRVGLLDRDVVDQRHRPRADAEQIVDVHRDAVDADRVVFAHHVGDHRLRAHPVGGDREANAADIDDVGEIADRQLHRAEARFRPSRRRCARRCC